MIIWCQLLRLLGGHLRWSAFRNQSDPVKKVLSNQQYYARHFRKRRGRDRRQEKRKGGGGSLHVFGCILCYNLDWPESRKGPGVGGDRRQEKRRKRRRKNEKKRKENGGGGGGGGGGSLHVFGCILYYNLDWPNSRKGPGVTPTVVGLFKGLPVICSSGGQRLKNGLIT